MTLLVKNKNLNSTDRALFVLNLLSLGKFSKNQIIEEFKKQNINITISTINNYLEKLKQYEIPIKSEKENNISYYFLEKKFIEPDFTQEELSILQDIKKLLILEKNFDNIRKAMRIFYKVALLVDNQEKRLQLIDFEYYSKINWRLVKELKNHCLNKNIITFDYLLPNGNHRFLTLHCDKLKVDNTTDRLYLWGVLENDYKFSRLPIDKIFMIKNIKEKNVRFDMEVKVLTYKISKEIYKKTTLDEKETMTNIKNNIVTIKRPIDDSFSTIQRLMYFCPDLYYISDEKIKKSVEEKLLILKDSYDTNGIE